MTRKLALQAETAAGGVSRGNARFAGVGAATFAHASHDGDEFFHWLAGFIDGEGSFCIRRNGTWGNVTFILKVRADDADIIGEVRRRTGFGNVYRIAASGTSKAQVAWQVERKADAAALVRLLDRYPLRAKKRNDYAVWRRAVVEWGGLNRAPVLEALKAQLESGRAFDADPADEQPAVIDGQLDLLEAA